MEINKIYNEDCLDTIKRIPNESVDLILTSPPYDDMRTYEGNDFAFHKFKKIADNLYHLIRIGGVIVWIVGDQTIKGNETGSSFRQALYFKDIGLNLFYTMIYKKSPQGAVGNNKTYWQSFEYMFILSKGTPTTINLIKDRENVDARKPYRNTSRQKDGSLKSMTLPAQEKFGRRLNVWEYRTGKGHTTKDKIAFEHPAVFPEDLAKDHIISWSNEGDIVYDPFMGSGTTAKMCIELNRNWIGSEVSEEYCNIAHQRIGLT